MGIPDRLGSQATQVQISSTVQKISVTSYVAALRKGVFVPPFFQYNKRLFQSLLRQKAVGACLLYMPQDGHWLASFEVIRPPPQNKGWFLRGQKLGNLKITAVSDMEF